MRKKYIYISLLISTGIYAIADYYCIYNNKNSDIFLIYFSFSLQFYHLNFDIIY